jgi:predicted nucleic acid-binding protein
MNGSVKVLVDTSVWIEFFRGREPGKSAVEKLMDDSAICCTGLVAAELIQGARSEREIGVIKDFVSVFDFLEEGTEVWEKAGRLAYQMRKKGTAVPLSDCYLAVLASGSNAAVMTLDRHFDLLTGEIPLEVIKPEIAGV